MNTIGYLRSALGGALLSICLLSVAQLNTDAAFQQAKSEFRLASDDKQLESNAEKLQQLVQQNPGQALLLAYSGAATSRLAMTTIFPWKKLNYAESGLAMLDKALILFSRQNQGIQSELEAKFVAANTFLAVPEFMNRQQRGQQLLNEVLKHKELPTLDTELHAAILFKGAQQASTAKNPELARQYLKQLLTLQTKLAGPAQAMLKGLSS